MIPPKPVMQPKKDTVSKSKFPSKKIIKLNVLFDEIEVEFGNTTPIKRGDRNNVIKSTKRSMNRLNYRAPKSIRFIDESTMYLIIKFSVNLLLLLLLPLPLPLPLTFLSIFILPGYTDSTTKNITNLHTFRKRIKTVQLHNREDVEKLIADHKADDKLLVLDVGLKHCGPCVKVYPTVLKLSKQMDTVVFARMNGDENDSCMQFLKDMEVVEVPTFLFIREGEICGRYVGSGRGELIGEILRYQGVRVTY